MINIAICDDERSEIEYLRKIIGTWAREEKQDIRINNYSSGESFLFEFGEDKQFDIVLLDIQMSGMNGVSLAKKIRAVNKMVQIIFVTGYMEYISDGYDVEALHYLIKPVAEEKLAAILNRAVEKLERNERVLLISHSGENIMIPFYEIRYLEVWHNYVTVYADKKYLVKKTLGELGQKLDDGFFRTGRSFIVNLRYIRKITKTEVHLSDGAVIPLSRNLYEKLNRAVIERM